MVKTVSKMVEEASFTNLTAHLPVTFPDIDGSSFYKMLRWKGGGRLSSAVHFTFPVTSFQ